MTTPELTTPRNQGQVTGAEAHLLLPLLGVYGRTWRRPSELRTSRTRRDLIAPCSATATTERGDDWADIIDMLTMHPDDRRRIVQ